MSHKVEVYVLLTHKSTNIECSIVFSTEYDVIFVMGIQPLTICGGFDTRNKMCT